MEELWKGIEVFGFNSETGIATFEVSNMGRVRKAGYYDDAMKYHEPELLKIYVNKNTNLRIVRLHIGFERKSMSLHKLVGDAFVQKPLNAEVVRWKDGDMANCCADNLYWDIKAKTRASTGGSRGKPVRVYSDKLELLGEFISCAEAGRQLRVSKCAITQCCRGVDPSYLGFKWQFVENDKYYKAGMKPKCSTPELLELCSTRASGLPRCTIRQYSVGGDFLGEYSSLDEIALKCHVWYLSVVPCCKRECAKGAGYVWRYAVDDELVNLSKSDRYLLIKKIIQEFNHDESEAKG